MRMMFAMMRDMQNPNVTPDGMNLWPLARLRRRRVMWLAAPVMNRARKTAQIGMSRDVVGRPPIEAVLGAYGPPIWDLLELVQEGIGVYTNFLYEIYTCFKNVM